MYSRLATGPSGKAKTPRRRHAGDDELGQWPGGGLQDPLPPFEHQAVRRLDEERRRAEVDHEPGALHLPVVARDHDRVPELVHERQEEREGEQDRRFGRRGVLSERESPGDDDVDERDQARDRRRGRTPGPRATRRTDAGSTGSRSGRAGRRPSSRSTGSCRSASASCVPATTDPTGRRSARRWGSAPDRGTLRCTERGPGRSRVRRRVLRRPPSAPPRARRPSSSRPSSAAAPPPTPRGGSGARGRPSRASRSRCPMRSRKIFTSHPSRIRGRWSAISSEPVSRE